MLSRVFGALLLTMTTALTGCGSSSSSTSPLAPFQPQISNLQDSFQFQATGVTSVTWTFTYTWPNSGTAASLNQSTTIAAGTATITVLDANGTQVYTNSLSANGTFATSTGVAGNWTLRVVFTSYSGTPNFRAQKA